MLCASFVRLLYRNGHGLRRRIQRSKGLRRRLLLALHSLHQHEHGSSIAPNATFGSEPCFPHGERSIYISGGAVIGARAVIFQQVTIGSNMTPGSRRFGCPVIGADCYIGAGAKVIGAVRIGERVRIGANAVVTEDVPDDSVVVVGPQIVRPTGRVDNRFYTWRNGWAYFDDGVLRPVSDPAVLAALEHR